MKNTSQIIFEIIHHFFEKYFNGSKKYWREEYVSIVMDMFYLEEEKGAYLGEFYDKLLEEYFVLYEEEEDRNQHEKVSYYFYELDFEEDVILKSLLQNLFAFLFLELKQRDFFKYKLEDNANYQQAQAILNKNIRDFLANFSEVRTDICVEVLEKSLAVPFKEIAIKKDFLLFQLMNSYENINIVTTFSNIDDAGTPDVSEGIYAILKLEETVINSDRLIKVFIQTRCNGDEYGDFFQISSFEAKQLLRQMAMFRAGSRGIEQRVSPKEAKQIVSELMHTIGMGYEFYTNVRNVENPFHEPGKIYHNAYLFSGSEGVCFFAIGKQQLYFFQQTWNYFSE